MKKLYIVGASTLGLTVAEMAKRTGDYFVEGFFDDDVNLASKVSARIIGRVTDMSPVNLSDCKIVIAVGSNEDRKRVFDLLVSRGLSGCLDSVIDPAAQLLGNVSVGVGSIIFPGAVLGPQVSVGLCSIINGNAYIGSGSLLGSFSNICPGACVGSASKMGDGVFVGMHASVLQGLCVAPWVKVGAGAVVLNNLSEAGVFSGLPARKTSDA